jgi:hypothetical protein
MGSLRMSIKFGIAHGVSGSSTAATSTASTGGGAQRAARSPVISELTIGALTTRCATTTDSDAADGTGMQRAPATRP